jgi:hypothetical protein
LWHFPVEPVVRAPLLQKAPGRKGEPPMSLPAEPQEQEVPLDDVLAELEGGEKVDVKTEKKTKSKTQTKKSLAEKQDQRLESVTKEEQKDDIFAEVDKEMEKNKKTDQSPSPPPNLPIA